ncbi:ABC transporter permease [Vibrio hepatarius]|uniref:ABC transporter permease n=1 Tax=Vibrio hepatarius TaxID=171383 RepID=UPI003736CF83
MESVVDIPWLTLALFFSLLAIPLAISRLYQLKISQEILLSVGRMTLQLLLVGVYLEYLFTLNSFMINIVWIALMMLIGASAIISKAKLPRKPMIMPVVIGLLLGLLPVLSIITLAIIQPTPLYNAQYLVPLAGMLLGNSMSGNIVSLQSFFSALEERQGEYQAAISLGASKEYATLPFVREAIQRSLAPTLATMTTSGLVTLPGMMTGQILGGASPIVAIKYQIMIMVAIFVMMSISITLSLRLTVRNCINNQGKILVRSQ